MVRVRSAEVVGQTLFWHELGCKGRVRRAFARVGGCVQLCLRLCVSVCGAAMVFDRMFPSPWRMLEDVLRRAKEAKNSKKTTGDEVQIDHRHTKSDDAPAGRAISPCAAELSTHVTCLVFNLMDRVFSLGAVPVVTRTHTLLVRRRAHCHTASRELDHLQVQKLDDLS